ncbi:WD40 repeat domain-containing protein [Streptosporangiaceae bacterium NEAU-GS5]|nr:WD40 repeat domain-containing protein [Streptosporangiaceae bacterium NEAU-GS5]
MTGASGAGKSSLIYAGLLPALADSLGPRSTEHWVRVVMRPMSSPARELALRIGEATGEPLDMNALSGDQARHAIRGALVPRSGPAGVERRLLVVVDQFEEMFTQVQDERERTVFIEALCSLVNGPGPATVVVMAVRGDFWDRCAEYPDLGSLMERGRFPVLPMTESQLHRTIAEPAEAAGLSIDPGLIPQILHDLHDREGRQAGALPLLSMAMSGTYDRSPAGRLTKQAYLEGGGVAKVVETIAEKAYLQLSPRRRDVAEQLLRRLVAAVDRDDEPARLRVALTRIKSGLPTDDADKVLEAFTGLRLILNDGSTVELAHDVLLSAWPRLRNWLADGHAARILLAQVERDASEWENHGRDASYLYSPTRLTAVRHGIDNWKDHERMDVPPLVAQFLSAGKEAARRHFLRRWFLAGVSVLLVFATAVSVLVARLSQESADHEHFQTLARSLGDLSEGSGDNDPALGQLLAAASWHFQQGPDSRYALLGALARPSRARLAGHREDVYGVAISPDGSRIASGGRDNTVRLWNTATRSQIGKPLRGHDQPVSIVVFSPSGKLLASGGTDGTVHLWDAFSGRALGKHDFGAQQVKAVGFVSNDLLAVGYRNTIELRDPHTWHVRRTLRRATGNVIDLTVFEHRLAAACDDGSVALWNLDQHQDTPVHRQVGHSDAVASVAFSTDGRLLVSGGQDGQLRLWDGRTGIPRGPSPKALVPVVSQVAFAQESTILASAGSDGLRLWDASDGSAVYRPLGGRGQAVHAVAFGPHGMFVTGGADGMVRLWQIPTGTPAGLLDKLDAAVQLAVSSPDGRIIAVAVAERVMLWDPAAQKLIGAPLDGDEGLVNGLAFNHDGSLLAAAGADGVVVIWDLIRHRPTRLSYGHRAGINSVQFSKDDRTLLAANLRTAWRWDVSSGRVLEPVYTHPESWINAVALSPDAKTLVMGGQEGALTIWDVRSGRRTHTIRTNSGAVLAIGFTADGSLLASGGQNGLVQVWDTATWRQRRAPLTGHDDPVTAVAFSPQEHILASGGSDGRIILSDADSGRSLGPTLGRHTHTIRSLAFDQAGNMVSGSEDATVRRWYIGIPGKPYDEVCRAAARDFTDQEWTLYLSGERRVPVCR